MATKSLGWAARITSLVSLGVIALFVVGTGGEALGLLFFPFGVVAGIIVAWRHEGIGGGISIVSLAAFYIWHTTLRGTPPGGPYFILLAAPGMLFVLSWLLRQPRKTPGASNG